MGFLDKISKKNKDGNVENISSITSEKAVSLIRSLSGADNRYDKRVIDNVVVFTNASGGTGASTLVANMGYVAAREGLRVIIIDLNLLTPIQHAYMGIQPEIGKKDMVDYLLGRCPLGEAIITKNEDTLSAVGISLMFANNRAIMDSLNCEDKIAVRNFKTALEKCKQLYDLVLIDCPMKIEHAMINTAMYKCDQMYMVWDEGLSSVANTERLRRNMALCGIEAYTKMRIVLNKRTNITYSEYPFNKLNLELIETLPFDPDIIESSLRGQIFCKSGSSSSKNANIFASKIEILTAKVLENGGYKFKKGGKDNESKAAD